MFVTKNIIRCGLTLVSSNDIITTKIVTKNVKNHKKIIKQKRLLEKIVKWTKGKRTPIMRWKKDNLQILTLKKCFKTIIIP